MKLVIKKAIEGGKVAAISSKSHAHRVLICAALADTPTFVNCLTTSQDIYATVRCLQALGATINRQHNGFWVNPIQEVCKGEVLDCGESGSTLRFLMPVAAALEADSTFLIGGRLPERKDDALCDLLARPGC